MTISNNFYHNTDLNLTPSKATANIKEKELLSSNEELFKAQTQAYNTISYNSEFGFRINEAGFFTKDLNKASALPLEYSLHIKSAQLIADEMIKQDENLSYSKLDLPKILNSYYNILKSVNSDFETKDNESLSRAKISSLVQAFSTEDTGLDSAIISLYDEKAYNEVLAQNKFLKPLKLSNETTSFAFDSALISADNTLIKNYLNKDGSITKSGLLANFIHKDLEARNRLFIEPMKVDIKAHQNFYKLKKGELNIDEFIKESNKEQMSFDLYLYVNGVDKKTASDEQLNAFYIRYTNEAKKINLDDFMSSSSIFELYDTELKTQLAKMSENSNTSEEKLSQINEKINTLNENFSKHRKKQASIENIIKSYQELMG